MSNELFIDVTEEQQQIVAGGSDGFYYSVPGIDDSIYTSYAANQSLQSLSFNVASGPGGSSVSQQFTNFDTSIYTDASKYFAFRK